MKLFASLFFTAFVVPFVAADLTINDLVVDDNRFETLSELVAKAELGIALANPLAELTVLAPTDEAFAKLPSAVTSYLLNEDNVDDLIAVLLYHVIPGEIFAHDIPRRHNIRIETLLDDALVELRSYWYYSWHHWRWFRRVVINRGEAYVTDADIDASNGVIHAIDTVLIPPDFELPKDLVDTAIDNGLDTLVTAVIAADLVDTLKDEKETCTVFAPSNEAFAALDPALLKFLLRNSEILRTVLLHHVVIGAAVSSSDIIDGTIDSTMTAQEESITLEFIDPDVVINANDLDEAKVVVADVVATNGVAHVIDTVLIPSAIRDVLPIPNIVDAVVENENLSTLEIAVLAAGLDGVLAGDGPFTVFAPTNDAFDALGADDLNALLADPQGALKDILLYHVAESYYTAEDILDYSPFYIGAVNGESIIARSPDHVSVVLDDGSDTDANVIVANGAFLNGIVHVIDKVLVPPDCPYHSPHVCWWFGYYR